MNGDFAKRRERAAIVVGAALAAATTAACTAKERYTANVSYVIGPKQPLPPGLKAVAVLDSGVQTVGAQESDRERKWSTIAADMIEAMLQAGSQRFGVGLAVAKRRDTARVLAEHDLKLAGLVEGETATRTARLLAVQGLITSRITVKIDIQKGTKSTIDWVGVMGGVVSGLQESRESREPKRPPKPRLFRDPRYVRDPRSAYERRPGPPVVERREGRAAGGGLTLKTKDVEEISRHLTVQCSFSLIDAATGQAIAQYSPAPYQKKDTASPHFLFGSAMSEADLDPVDHFIGELVERATQEFVSGLVPVQVDYKYNLVGRGKDGEAGIRLLRADDYDGAIQKLEAELRKDPDEHENMFALGVAYELKGDAVRALDCYRRAAATKGVDKEELGTYLAAKARLTEHIGRILRPTTAKPISPPQPEPSPAAPEAVPPAPPPPAPQAPAPAPAQPSAASPTAWTWNIPTSQPASQPATAPQ